MSDLPPPWLRSTPEGVRLEILVQPRASRSRVVGAHGDRLKLQIAAPPVEGEANEEVVRLLAAALGVPRRDVELAAGATGRRKSVIVRGVDASAVVERLLP